MLCMQNLLLWHVRMVGEEKAAGAMYAKLTIMVRQNDKKKTFLIRERFVIKAIRRRYFTKRRGGIRESNARLGARTRIIRVWVVWL